MSGFESPPFIKSENEYASSETSDMSRFANPAQRSWPNSENNQTNNFAFMAPSSGLRSNFSVSGGVPTTFNDDELAEFLDLDQAASQTQSSQPHFNQMGIDNDNDGNNYAAQSNLNGFQSMSMPAPQTRPQSFGNVDMYSNPQLVNTAAMHSPYGQSFDPTNVANMARMQQAQSRFRGPSSTMAQSPRANVFRGAQSYGSTPMSPNVNVGMGTMDFGTSEASSHGDHSLSMSRHRTASASQWEAHFGVGSPESEIGAVETPITSPMSVPRMQGQLGSIAEMQRGMTPRTKAAAAAHKAVSVPGGASKEELKKAKRRNAHNVVEQKRRDKINDRIQELSRLVPQHRLEDSNRKKQLASSAKGSSGIPGMSPPSNPLRRASVLSQPSAMEEHKTKGNSLDGAVAWTRDLMWMLERQLARESVLVEALQDLGHAVPYEDGEDERRMRSELMGAMQTSGSDAFVYSRADGSGQFVPGFTDVEGVKVSTEAAPDFYDYSQSLEGHNGQDTESALFDYTPESGRDSLEYKGSDEFVMDMS